MDDPLQKRKDAFKDLYGDLERSALARAGQEHLDNDITLRARRYRRLLWTAIYAAIAGIILAGIIGSWWLLSAVRGNSKVMLRRYDVEQYRD